MSLPEDPAPEAETAVPTAAQVAARLRREVGEITDAYAAEVADQANRCRVVPYAHPLAEAIYRRVARNLAMRALPLGVQSDEFGSTYLGGNDPEVRRLEGHYRRTVMG